MIYNTKDERPGILFTKQDRREFHAGNQPRLFDTVEAHDFDHLHYFAVQPSDGVIQLAITCRTNRNNAAIWFGLDAAQELIDALKIAVAQARDPHKGAA